MLVIFCVLSIYLIVSLVCLLLFIFLTLSVGGQHRHALPYLTSGVGRLLHLPSSEAVSARSNAHPRM